MKIRPLILSLLVGSSLGLAGCDSGEKKADAKKDDAKKDDAKAEDKKAEGDDEKAEEKAPEGPTEIALPTTGLKGMAPAGATVSAMMGNDMVQGPGMTATVGKGDDKPKTGEEATKEAGDYSPKDPKVETLEDGYVLTFTNEGGGTTNYWVNARREIDGAAWWCSTTAISEEQQKNVVEFCKSLKK